LEKFLNRQPDIPGNLPEKRWRNITPFMHGNGGAATVGVAVLDVRTTLAYGIEAGFFQ